MVGETCHHWNAHRSSRRSDSQSPNSHPFDQRTAFLWGSAISFFLFVTVNLTIKNLTKIALPFKNCSGQSSCNKGQRCRTKTSSPWIRDSRSLLSTQAQHSRLHQLRERVSNHHHCQRRQHQPQYVNQQSFLNSQGFRCLQDFIPCIFIMLSNQAQFSLSNQISNQFRSEEES